MLKLGSRAVGQLSLNSLLLILYWADWGVTGGNKGKQQSTSGFGIVKYLHIYRSMQVDTYQPRSIRFSK